jgi:hypothetical protein
MAHHRPPLHLPRAAKQGSGRCTRSSPCNRVGAMKKHLLVLPLWGSQFSATCSRSHRSTPSFSHTNTPSPYHLAGSKPRAPPASAKSAGSGPSGQSARSLQAPAGSALQRSLSPLRAPAPSGLVLERASSGGALGLDISALSPPAASVGTPMTGLGPRSNSSQRQGSRPSSKQPYRSSQRLT